MSSNQLLNNIYKQLQSINESQTINEVEDNRTKAADPVQTLIMITGDRDNKLFSGNSITTWDYKNINWDRLFQLALKNQITTGASSETEYLLYFKDLVQKPDTDPNHDKKFSGYIKLADGFSKTGKFDLTPDALTLTNNKNEASLFTENDMRKFMSLLKKSSKMSEKDKTINRYHILKGTTGLTAQKLMSSDTAKSNSVPASVVAYCYMYVRFTQKNIEEDSTYKSISEFLQTDDEKTLETYEDLATYQPYLQQIATQCVKNQKLTTMGPILQNIEQGAEDSKGEDGDSKFDNAQAQKNINLAKMQKKGFTYSEDWIRNKEFLGGILLAAPEERDCVIAIKNYFKTLHPEHDFRLRQELNKLDENVLAQNTIMKPSSGNDILADYAFDFNNNESPEPQVLDQLSAISYDDIINKKYVLRDTAEVESIWQAEFKDSGEKSDSSAPEVTLTYDSESNNRRKTIRFIVKYRGDLGSKYYEGIWDEMLAFKGSDDKFQARPYLGVGDTDLNVFLNRSSDFKITGIDNPVEYINYGNPGSFSIKKAFTVKEFRVVFNMDDPKKPQLVEVKIDGFEQLKGNPEEKKPETPETDEAESAAATEVINNASEHTEQVDKEFDEIIKFLNDYKAAEGTEAKKNVIRTTTLKPERLKDLGSLVGSMNKVKGIMDKEKPTTSPETEEK